ncbi:lysosomal alpha-mannosidase-like [Diabrotica undecimpunctata]|uniref:lysosomal alpha-mannosidase-like n=1 Tax=Diabrotica undecimpunctata TaxID=50387 RepID=UPI003B63BB39
MLTKISIFILLVLCLTLTNAKYFESCALKACATTNSSKINVHLIAHSHDDLGWLKTAEDYFYGEHNDIQNGGVQYVLDSVLQALTQNEDRRFIQAETAYFWKWWQIQPENKRQIFKKFVDAGRIEMVGGGWSMNDEACVNYQSTINQLTWGLRILNDTLGECGRPKIGWQIGTFGHSREQASIFQQMDYNGIFFTHISDDIRATLNISHNLEFMWTTNDNFEKSNIFTSIMGSYYAPSGFCWDYVQCSSDAINDDPDSFDYNLDKKVDEFAQNIDHYAKYFRTKNILYPMGGDLQYQAAEINYINIDKLIKGFQNHPVYNQTYNIFYSTPSCYVKEIEQSGVLLEHMTTEDFFPYNENQHSYWSGLYTSRPALKKLERTSSNILKAAQQINSFAKMRKIINGSKAEENLRSLREAVATVQDHNAITGTQKERVAQDYSRMLRDAIKTNEENVANILRKLLKVNESAVDVKLPLSTCLLTNVSICEHTMKSRSLIVVYNPLTRPIDYFLRIPVNNVNYTLTGPEGFVDFDIVRHMQYPIKYPSSSDYELVAAINIPPMGLKVYYLEKVNDKSVAIEPQKITGSDPVFLKSGTSTLRFDPITRTHNVTINNRTEKVTQEFLFYRSNNGSADGISSGAYVFRQVAGNPPLKVFDEKYYEVSYIEGKVVQEIIQRVGKYVTQTIRLHSEKANDDSIDYVEFDWMIGPLDNNTVDIKNNVGKEIIAQYSLDGIENFYFYTDSNGRQMLERQKNDIPYTDLTKEAFSSNYYPVTSVITLKDYMNNLKWSILTDRAQGGANVKVGYLELMLHRRTLEDDHKGIEEALQEMEFGKYAVTRGSHYLTMSYVNDSKVERILALNKLLQPWVLTADATSDDLALDKLQKIIKFQWNGLTINEGKGLANNINILNFEPWKEDTYLLRLEHILAIGEDKELSEKASVDLKYLFDPFVISSISELTLGANEFIDDKDIESFNDTIVLEPMEIRTFLITLDQN